jgi:hypothetical protein
LLSLSLAIAHPSVDLVGNLLPLLLASFFNESLQEHVFIILPRLLLGLLLVLRLPLVVALIVVAARDQTRYVLPVDHALQFIKNIIITKFM